VRRRKREIDHRGPVDQLDDTAIDDLYHRTLREYAKAGQTAHRNPYLEAGAIIVAKFMRPETALARLAEDEHAPIRARLQALQQLAHPPLCTLRRLLAETSKRVKPVPSKVRALAALKYAQETQYQKTNAAKAKTQVQQSGNALGII
jgi:hypothetical protein